MDYLYRVERILQDGEATVKEVISSPGGSAANTIYGLARLGIKTGFIGAVGSDADGKAILEDFNTAGVDTGQIKRKRGVRTGSVIGFTDELGRRALYVLPGANNRLTRNDLDLSYTNQAGVFHLSSYADDRQFKLSVKIVEALAPEVKVSFAPGALYVSRGLKALLPVLKRTAVLFLNHDEMEQLAGKDIRIGAENCLKTGCRIVAVTLGKGIKLKAGKKPITAISYIRDARKEYLIAPPPGGVSIADTTGAGDAFAAGFLYGWRNDKDLETCGRIGNTVARCSIKEIGARRGLPTLNELAQRYRELYGEAL